MELRKLAGAGASAGAGSPTLLDWLSLELFLLNLVVRPEREINFYFL